VTGSPKPHSTASNRQFEDIHIPDFEVEQHLAPDLSRPAARQIRASQVFVNEWYADGVETPFGGYEKSGYGCEKGREALWNYVQTKNVAIKLKG
jgi:hypothetical protein